jgi:hypothetical protein
MTSRKLFATFVALAMISVGYASADIIYPANCSATCPPGGLTISPGGYDAIGPTHTIDVYVNDINGDPVEILSTDIWLEHETVVWCPGGVIADSSTYAPDPGHTTFTSVARGGVDQGDDVNGWNECMDISLNVVALGYVIQVLEGDNKLSVNSMDLNGDGLVGSQDWAKFGRCKGFSSREGCSCADYNEDYYPGGTPNVEITDQAQYANQHNASTCP